MTLRDAPHQERCAFILSIFHIVDANAKICGDKER